MPISSSSPNGYHDARRGAYGMDVQTVPGTLRGYRAWRADRDWRFLGLYNTGLRAVGMSNFVWSSPTPARAACSPGRVCFCDEAGTCFTCITERHRSPDPGCACGYYATYDPDSYKQHTRGLGVYIHGCIEAYGRISLGTLGFRAEYVRVTAVYGGSSAWAAARRYGVPWFGNQQRMLAAFPEQDVRELLR